LVIRNLVGVGIAVNLDDQSAIRAVKVHDEAPDGVLTAKLEAAQLPVAQTRPQLAFDWRLWLA
jgi:hypothetical protein